MILVVSLFLTIAWALPLSRSLQFILPFYDIDPGPGLTEDEFEQSRALIGQKPIDFSKPMEPEVSAGGKDGKLSAYSITDMWPQGTIHYMIDDRFTATERLAIAAGMADIVDNSCVHFTNVAQDFEGDFIHIT